MSNKIFYVWDEGENRDGPCNWVSKPEKPPYFSDSLIMREKKKLKKTICFDEYRKTIRENKELSKAFIEVAHKLALVVENKNIEKYEPKTWALCRNLLESSGFSEMVYKLDKKEK